MYLRKYRHSECGYWQAIIDEYKTLVDQIFYTDGSIATFVSKKKEQKELIKQTLNAVIGLIRSNYPKTYKSVIRSWGFQKEKY